MSGTTVDRQDSHNAGDAINTSALDRPVQRPDGEGTAALNTAAEHFERALAGEYTVKPGDTMGGIARRNDVALDDLLKANPQVENPDLIYPGQTLNIPRPNVGNNPSTSGAAPASGSPGDAGKTHEVALGDTMGEVASQYGVPLQDLIDANPQVDNPDLIYPGQTLNIPEGGQAASETPTVDGPAPADPAAPAAEAPAETPALDNAPYDGNLIYSDQVSPEFARKVEGVAERLGMDPNHLMAVMHFETGGTFDPAIENPASGATGLIQFLPSTARGLGTSTEELAAMSPEQQLDVVEQYLSPYAGRMDSVEDAYMAVFYPAAIGQPSDHTLFGQGSLAYRQNSGLDRNGDGSITKGEAASIVRQRLQAGLNG
ncbi:MAG: LysM peptidoglycan-binding domain-containing protein [Candidatus Competibacterales bacterium]